MTETIAELKHDREQLQKQKHAKQDKRKALKHQRVELGHEVDRLAHQIADVNDEIQKLAGEHDDPTGKPGDLWYPGAARVPLESAGSMAGGGKKIVLHTTEGTSADGAISALRAARAAPQFMIDPASGKVWQFMPVNQAGRALEHPSGPETNRANAVQIEMLGFAADTDEWPDTKYAHVKALCRWIEGAWGVPRKAAKFGVGVPRMSGEAFYAFAGYCGHEHVPGNSHWDPGDFRIAELV